MKQKSFDLYEISRARPHLLGLATLWVALFHSYSLNFFQSDFLNKVHLVGILNRLKETGNCGVDLFLFLSGLGLFFSYTRVLELSNHPIREFYKRRFVRILPPVLIVSILYYGLAGTKSFFDWLGKVFLFGSFFPAQDVVGYWYFALLLILYLSYPLLDRILRQRPFSGTAALTLAFIGIAVLLRFLVPSYFDEIEIMLTRIPVFLFGAFFGCLCQHHKDIPRIIPILSIPAAIAGLLVIPAIPFPGIYLRRYVYALWTIAIVLSHAFLCCIPKRKSILYRIVCLIGLFSLEIYLIYENLYVAGLGFFKQADEVGIVYAITVFTASLMLSALLKTVLNLLREQYRRIRL